MKLGHEHAWENDTVLLFIDIHRLITNTTDIMPCTYDYSVLMVRLYVEFG